VWSYYQIAKDGDILRVTRRDAVVSSVTDVNGNELENYRDPRIRETLYQSFLPLATLASDPRLRWEPYSRSDRFFLRLNVGGQVNWYYVFAEGRVRGYALDTRRCIGSLGPDGFVPAGQRTTARFAEPLPPYSWTYAGVLADANAVYRLDFFTQEVERLFTPGDNGRILGAAVVLNGSATENRRIAIAMVTRDHLEVHALNGALLFSLAQPFSLEKCGEINVGAPDEDHYLLWYRPSWTAQALARWTLLGHVLEISADGRELKRTELPPLNVANPEAWYKGLWAALVPLAAAFVEVAWAGLLTALGDIQGAVILADLRRELTTSTPAFLAASFSALATSIVLCTALARLIARRYAFPRQSRNWWALLTVLGGPAGLLLLLALREWPAREACPACGQKRVVDRDHCEHCGAAFPVPSMDGTEILTG
jgi:hypothetical protein